MAGTILTPNTIWKNFSIQTEFKTRVVKEVEDGDAIFTHVYVGGRAVKDGNVDIFGVFARSVQQGVGPAVLIVKDFEVDGDDKLVKHLIKRGYSVFVVDVAGMREGVENYTVYPKSLSHANYQNVKDSLYTISKDVQATCWYEWACVCKYAIAYLKSRPDITKVGGIGMGESATVLWEVAGSESDLDCAVFALNAGWIGYRGIEKFGGKVEPQFSDNMYKFIAGVDPQAYAMHVNCPTLVLSATNSKKFDADRAYDTVTRINEEVYSAINYSVGYRERVGSSAFVTANLFLKYFLFETDGRKMPSEVDIKCEIEDGELVVTVKADETDLDKVALFVAEEISDPSKRSWIKTTDYKGKTEDGFVFRYKPFNLSEMATMFAQAYYKDGYTIGSHVMAKKFNKEDIGLSHKSNIIYSSRNEHSESVFSASRQDDENSDRINATDESRVRVLKGPMNVSGAYSKWGLVSFKINALKDKPNDNAILMFDVYSAQKGLMTVRLISDYYGNKTEYVAWVTVHGGEVWQNVKLDLLRFKTEEGMPLRSYSKIEAIEFKTEEGGKQLINNALWV